MASQSEGGGKDDIKTHFVTREGTYRLMPLSEYSKPTRTQFNGQVNAPVKVSFINVNDGSPSPDRICFNVGRELYFYVYKGVKKAADLTKPIDKRIYKGTFPTCHDFNTLLVSPESVRLLVGFTAGQIQLIDPIKKELGKLYNEERLIDKTKVTSIKWIPGSPNQFLVSHASGQMYVYNEELPCGPTPPHYQLFKQGEGFAVYTCKTKSTRNPLYRWVVGQGAINEFAFSPCFKYLAVVSQDGYLRIFNYDSMELVGTMKSYFGGLLCVSWSPDSKYIVIGGEDDLVSVWSFHEKRVICRGQGHRSWIGVVAFDPYTSVIKSESDDSQEYTPDEDVHNITSHNPKQDLHEGIANGGTLSKSNRNSVDSSSRTLLANSPSSSVITTYRFGSIGQDTMLCLWDLTEDVLKQPAIGKSRTSVLITGTSLAMANTLPRCSTLQHSQKTNSVGGSEAAMDGHMYSMSVNANTKFNTLSAVADRKETQEKKEHKRNFSLAGRSDKSSIMKSSHMRPMDDAFKLLGTLACPRLEEVPILEPHVCKKVSTERLSTLLFREDCIVTACQDGLVNTWARPGKVGLAQHTVMSPQASVGEMYPM